MHIFTLSSEELIGAHHGRTVFVFTDGPRDSKTANKTTKPNVINFYYLLFDFICFLLYVSDFFFSGMHTGSHVRTLRTSSCSPESQNSVNFTV